MKEQFLERWRALAVREQRLLLAGIAAVVLTVIFLGIIEPLSQLQSRRETALMQSRALAQRLEEISAELQSTRGSVPPSALKTLSLLTAVDQSVKQSAIGKAPSRLQPEGDKQVRIWFEAVSFDALARWLHELETRYGVFTLSADIEREAAGGQVSAQLTLMRP